MKKIYCVTADGVAYFATKGEAMACFKAWKKTNSIVSLSACTFILDKQNFCNAINGGGWVLSEETIEIWRAA